MDTTEGKKLDHVNLRSFTLNNGNTYKYRDLTPIEAIPFCAQVAKVLSPFMTAGQSVGEALSKALSNISATDVTEILKKALGRCYNSKSESLGNEAVFNSWFSDHPDELLEAGGRAVYNLALPFMPTNFDIPSLGNK